MVYKLAGLGSRRREVQAVHDVVQSALEKDDEVVAGLAWQAEGLLEDIAELTLHEAIAALERLLLAKLHRIFRFLSDSGLRGLSGRKALLVDRALVAPAALALQKELSALCTAESAHRSSISSHSVTPSQMRRAFRGLQPLWGIGVTSLIDLTLSPITPSWRIADSRPMPGPFTYTCASRRPACIAFCTAASVTVWAANGVDFFAPRNSWLPELDHEIAFPLRSVTVTIVLLKVA